MPELPDLEVLVGNLLSKVKSLEIEKIMEIDKGSIKGLLQSFENLGSINGISRRGKYIIFQTDKLSFYIHLMLSGKVSLTRGTLPEGSRFALKLSDGSSLAVLDKRRLAYLGTNLSDLPEGIEPLSSSFTFENFHKILEKGKKKNLKAFLMDQDLIAGIGNAYSDEIMFTAMLNPLRKIESLNNKEQKKLYDSIIGILKQAIEDVRKKMGNGFELDEERLYLQVHKRKGEKCPICGGKIETVKANGKVAYYCPTCQK
jgi:formamidopyrimidine-DNA glycosylase